MDNLDPGALILAAPFKVPYAYGNVKQKYLKPKFDTSMRERLKELRIISKKERDDKRKLHSKFIRIGCQLNIIQRLVYIEHKSQIKTKQIRRQEELLKEEAKKQIGGV